MNERPNPILDPGALSAFVLGALVCIHVMLHMLFGIEFPSVPERWSHHRSGVEAQSLDDSQYLIWHGVLVAGCLSVGLFRVWRALDLHHRGVEVEAEILGVVAREEYRSWGFYSGYWVGPLLLVRYRSGHQEVISRVHLPHGEVNYEQAERLRRVCLLVDPNNSSRYQVLR